MAGHPAERPPRPPRAERGIAMTPPDDPQRAPELPAAAEIAALVGGAHGDPFRILGMHEADGGPLTVRAFIPGASAVEVIARASGRPVAAQIGRASRGGMVWP